MPNFLLGVVKLVKLHPVARYRPARPQNVVRTPSPNLHPLALVRCVAVASREPVQSPFLRLAGMRVV